VTDETRSPGLSEPFNPYQAPLTGASATEGGSPAEMMRRKYLSHEASVQSIGTLCLLGSGLLGIFAVPAFFVELAAPSANRIYGLGILSFAVGLVVCQLALAFGLSKLRPWARPVGGFLRLFGLIGFPIGTLISIYVLYLLFSTKGSVVFSEEYRAAVAQTPHVIYKTSTASWVVLILFLGLIGFGVVAALVLG